MKNYPVCNELNPGHTDPERLLEFGNCFTTKKNAIVERLQRSKKVFIEVAYWLVTTCLTLVFLHDNPHNILAQQHRFYGRISKLCLIINNVNYNQIIRSFSTILD